jgi:hypothetical protein
VSARQHFCSESRHRNSVCASARPTPIERRAGSNTSCEGGWARKNKSATTWKRSCCLNARGRETPKQANAELANKVFQEVSDVVAYGTTKDKIEKLQQKLAKL